MIIFIYISYIHIILFIYHIRTISMAEFRKAHMHTFCYNTQIAKPEKADFEQNLL